MIHKDLPFLGTAEQLRSVSARTDPVCRTPIREPCLPRLDSGHRAVAQQPVG